MKNIWFRRSPVAFKEQNQGNVCSEYRPKKGLLSVENQIINKTKSQSDFIITMHWQYQWYSTCSCWGWQLLLPILPTLHLCTFSGLWMPRINLSVQFKYSVVSDSLWPHEMQHAKQPCASPMLRACSNSRPLSPWCPLTISSSITPSFPAFNLSQH